MKRQLKQEVLASNIKLPSSGLVILTWGNASAIDRECGEVVIKPSGVLYEELKLDDLVVVDLEGHVVEGKLKPSSDLMTHLEIYRHFQDCSSVIHTHSRMATAWAQAGIDIPVFGTTHADYFYGGVPCTRVLSKEEIQSEYEVKTGQVIVETFKTRGIDPISVPGVLVHGHGPFVWGKSSQESLQIAFVLEEIATIAWCTRMLIPDIKQVSQYLLDKHFTRKHGDTAYYGQS